MSHPGQQFLQRITARRLIPLLIRLLTGTGEVQTRKVEQHPTFIGIEGIAPGTKSHVLSELQSQINSMDEIFPGSVSHQKHPPRDG
jgi:hypothetical protein